MNLENEMSSGFISIGSQWFGFYS